MNTMSSKEIREGENKEELYEDEEVEKKLSKEEFLKIYWKQYRLLEKIFIQTDEYVSISKDNYDTFSNRYVNLLLLICSEMDSLLGAVSSSHKYQSILKKFEYFVKEHPNVKNYRVDTKYPYDIKNITPMVKFSEKNQNDQSDKTSEKNKKRTPDWWQAYNDVKHRRAEQSEGGRYNYTKASLKNVLFSLASLYIISQLIYENLDGNGQPSSEGMVSDLFEEYKK